MLSPTLIKKLFTKVLFGIFLYASIFTADAQTIIAPGFVLKSHETLDIVRVVKTDEQIMFHMVIRNQLSEGGNFCVDRNTEIIAGDKTIKVKRIIGIPECPESWSFTLPGEELQFYLHFPPVPDNVKVIDLVENCPDNCFSFYGIAIDEELNSEIEKAFDYYESGMLTEALSSYKNLLTKYSGTEPKLEALLYFYIISITLENSDMEGSETWLIKFRQADLAGSEWVEEKLQHSK